MERASQSWDHLAGELSLVLPDVPLPRILRALDKYKGSFDDTLDYLLQTPQDEPEPPKQPRSTPNSAASAPTSSPSNSTDRDVEKLKGMFPGVDEELVVMAFKRAGGSVYDAYDIIKSQLAPQPPIGSNSKIIATTNSEDDSDEIDSDDDYLVVEDDAYKSYLAEVLPFAASSDHEDDTELKIELRLRDSGDAIEVANGEDFAFYREAQKQAEVSAALRKKQLEDDSELAFKMQLEMLSLNGAFDGLGSDEIANPFLDFPVSIPAEDPNAMIKIKSKKGNGREEKFKYIPDTDAGAYLTRQENAPRVYSQPDKNPTYINEEGHEVPIPVSGVGELRATASLPGPVVLPIPAEFVGRPIPLFNPMRDLGGPNVIDQIQNSFQKCGLNVTRIRSIMSPVLQRNFSIMMMTLPNSIPILTYHGTSIQNHASIVLRGLLVPGGGTGIKMVHGAAYGKGIYLGLNPFTSLGYVTAGHAMFVCAALTGHSFMVSKQSNFIVVGRSELVLPCFIVYYELKAQANVSDNQTGPQMVGFSGQTKNSVATLSKKVAQRQKMQEKKARQEKNRAKRY